MDSRVAMLWVPNSHYRYMPEGDAIFATGWQTVPSVLSCPPSKGRGFYLIQGYECWLGPKECVDATWRVSLQKVVIARWLLGLSSAFGDPAAIYVPNAVDKTVYQLKKAIESRPRQIAMLYSSVPVKGGPDGLAALELVRARYPDLQVSLFGTGRRPFGLSQWMSYYRCPSQKFLVERIYNDAIIYLNASLSEGCSLPVTEAAACGCALVATDIPGNRERIVHGVTGLLSPSNNPRRLAENVCELLSDDNFRIQLARNAYAATAAYDWEHSTSCLEEAILRTMRPAVVSGSTASRRIEQLALPDVKAVICQ